MTDTETTIELAADIAAWLNLYAEADVLIKQLEERKTAARERIEAALGDNETGTVAGRPAVRWSFVTSKRLDQKKAKALLGDRVDEAMVESTSRRFSLVVIDEASS